MSQQVVNFKYKQRGRCCTISHQSKHLEHEVPTGNSEDLLYKPWSCCAGLTHTHMGAHTQCTIRDVEESKASSRVIRSRVIGAEALHIVVGANGFLYGRIFTC